MSEAKTRFQSENEKMKFVEESGLWDRMLRGAEGALKEYFELSGAKIKSIKFSQPIKD